MTLSRAQARAGVTGFVVVSAGVLLSGCPDFVGFKGAAGTGGATSTGTGGPTSSSTSTGGGGATSSSTSTGGGGASSSSTTSSSSSTSSSSASSSGSGCFAPDVLCGAVCLDPTMDGANCGACGHDCLGGACVGGQCQPVALATSQSNPVGLAQDGANLYWANMVSGSVATVPKAGGTVVLLAPMESAPISVATDGITVFWVTTGSGPGMGALRSVPVGGGAPTTLAPMLPSPVVVAIDTTNVYWSDAAGIYTMPMGGGTAAQISTHGAPFLVAASGFAFSTYLPGNDVESVPEVGGTPTVLAANVPPSGLSVYGDHVYVGDLHTVARIPVAGGALVVMADDGGGAVTSTFADAYGVYWSNNLGTVSSLPAGGVTPVTRATGQNDPDFVLADLAAIYWLDVGAGSVMRVAR